MEARSLETNKTDPIPDSPKRKSGNALRTANKAKGNKKETKPPVLKRGDSLRKSKSPAKPKASPAKSQRGKPKRGASRQDSSVSQIELQGDDDDDDDE